MRTPALLLALVALAGPAVAQSAKPMDLKEVDATLLKEFYGTYEIRDRTGNKRCRVILKPEDTIGGSQITQAPGCDKAFPLMADITAWRLMQGWEIVLVDALRKSRIRFFTPDNRYVADPETDGIWTIVKVGRR